MNAASEAVDVEISGCSAIVAGPVCELPADGLLRVWIAAPPEAVAFATPSGAATSSLVRTVEGGSLYRVTLPPSAAELRVQRRGTTTRIFQLTAKSAPAWLGRARALRQSGDVAGAEALVRGAETSGRPEERAFALGLRARLELAAGRPEASFPLFLEAMASHRSAGRISDAADDGFALAFALNQRSHRYTDARAVLDGVHADVGSYPDGRAREAYYRGTLAMETGDARTALALLRDARVRAARLGLTLLERHAINAYALHLLVLGRTSEALELLGKLEADAAAASDATPCEMVEIAINTGFGALLANEEGAVQRDATAPLERALALTEDGCRDAYLRTAALSNLALAALQHGALAAAREHLAHARSKVHEARAVEVFFWHELEGRIALAEGDARRAFAAFDEEARLAHAALSFETEWRALAGKGEALERLGKDDDALRHYLEAEDLLGDLSLLVPLGEGRGTFLGDRGKTARAAVSLLVRRGSPERALAVARRSRARVLAALARTARLEGFDDAARARWERSLAAYRVARAALDSEAKDDWKLPRAEAARARSARDKKEEELRLALDAAFAVVAGRDGDRKADVLPPLPTDALTLTFHPARSGWIGLAADDAGVFAFDVAEVTPASSERLLEPIRDRLERARRVRVLPYGPLRSVDYHALQWNGQPLIATLPVEYPLDVAGGAGSDGARDAMAVVVADPTLDLVGARAEAEHVTRALEDRAWSVEVLTGPQATSSAVLSRMARARLLHYAGHGVFAGREGWESALPLAGGGRLTVSDILASSGAPARVVLSGCESARTSNDAPVESLGLAQAFVVAGADFVIAPIRPIDDALAAQMSSALYGELAEKDLVDAARELRTAQLRVLRETPGADWSAFRVLRRR